MNISGSVSRENKKRQLRRQIVPDNSGWQAEQETHRRRRRRRYRSILVVLLLLLAAVSAAFFFYNKYHAFGSYQILWEKNLTEGEGGTGEGAFCEYVDFADGVIKYTRDGASYLDRRGKAVWILSYEMRDPIIAVNGEYAAIADRQGNGIYICDKNGQQGQASTALPILDISISAKGVTAAIQEDSRASYIYLYRKDGGSLDIYVKSLLSGDGYPLDVGVSPGGTQWITSYMYLDQGMIRNKIVFYNFGMGKNDPRRVVGVFLPSDLGDALAGKAVFLDDSHSVIFTDRGLQFFSTRVETSPETISQKFLEERIRSISYSEKYVGVITDNTQGSDPYCMRIYGKDGREIFNRTFSDPYARFDIVKDMVLLYNEDSCHVYNMSGTQKFNGTFDFKLSKVTAGRSGNSLLVMGDGVMKEIRLR